MRLAAVLALLAACGGHGTAASSTARVERCAGDARRPSHELDRTRDPRLRAFLVEPRPDGETVDAGASICGRPTR